MDFNAWVTACKGALEQLFMLSAPMQLLVFVIHGVIVWGIAFSFLRYFNRKPEVLQWTPVAPFFAAISMIFALFLAFHAADIWTHKREAERAFIQAGSAIKRFDEMVSPTQLNIPEAHRELGRYVKYVYKDEWRKNRNQRGSDRAEGAFRNLQDVVLKATQTLPGPTATQLNVLMNDISRTRSDRLWIGGNHTEVSSWLAVILLGFLTHLAVASVHFDRQRAGASALALLASTTTIGYWSLGIVADPYRHSGQLNPAAWMDHQPD
jgi:hypothetical protein